MKILIAEDDERMRNILKLYLQKEGWETACVSNGEEVLDYFERNKADLLLYFLNNQDLVLSRERILDAVWGMGYEGDIRTVDTHIRRLRKKLGDACIQTVFGMGYRMGGTHE